MHSLCASSVSVYNFLLPLPFVNSGGTTHTPSQTDRRTLSAPTCTVTSIRFEQTTASFYCEQRAPNMNDASRAFGERMDAQRVFSPSCCAMMVDVLKRHGLVGRGVVGLNKRTYARAARTHALHARRHARTRFAFLTAPLPRTKDVPLALCGVDGIRFTSGWFLGSTFCWGQLGVLSSYYPHHQAWRGIAVATGFLCCVVGMNMNACCVGRLCMAVRPAGGVGLWDWAWFCSYSSLHILQQLLYPAMVLAKHFLRIAC